MQTDKSNNVGLNSVSMYIQTPRKNAAKKREKHDAIFNKNRQYHIKSCLK